MAIKHVCDGCDIDIPPPATVGPSNGVTRKLQVEYGPNADGNLATVTWEICEGCFEKFRPHLPKMDKACTAVLTPPPTPTR